MSESIEAFVDSAVDAFDLQGPFYELVRAGRGGSPRGCFPGVSDAGGDWMGDDADAGLAVQDAVARTVLVLGGLRGAPEPQRMAREVTRLLAPAGALLVCSELGRQQIDAAPAVWRSTPCSVQVLLAGMEATVLGWQGDDTSPQTVYGIGFKTPVPDFVPARIGPFMELFRLRLRQVAKRVGWWQRLRRFTTGCLPGPRKPQHRGADHQIQFAVHLPINGGVERESWPGYVPDGRRGSRLDLMQ